MRRHCASATVALALVLVGLAGASARDKKDLALSPQDYAELQHLTARLNQGADSHDSEMWVSVWTPDGIGRHQEAGAYVGHSGLSEYRRARREELGGRSDIRHWTNSLVITPSADGATGRL